MSWWQNILGKADNYFSEDERNEIARLEHELRMQELVIDSYQKEQNRTQKTLLALAAQVNAYQKKEASERQEIALETFWNNARPKASLKYKARPVFNTNKVAEVDPRTFLNHKDISLPVHGGKSNDEKATRIRSWVERNIEYEPEQSQFKIPECWLYSWETMILRKGDCEDGAILMCNMMRRSGIPYWRIRLNAGIVKGGGHAWVTYLRELDNKWVILDWCYWPEESADLKLLWSEAESKYFNIWFSLNEKHIFQGSNYDREART